MEEIDRNLKIHPFLKKNIQNNSIEIEGYDVDSEYFRVSILMFFVYF